MMETNPLFDRYTPPNPWLLALKNLVFPIFCRQCNARLLTDENGYFCATCWELCPRMERPFCTVCGQPFAGRAGFSTPNNFPCERCRNEPEPPYRRIFGAAHYDGSFAEAIRLLKFNGKVRLAGPIAETMAEFAARELDLDAYTRLVPVPLHRVRQRDRGFNQAELLANALLPIFPGATLDESLKRIRPTRAQSRLKDEEERKRNVAGAFAVPEEFSFDGETVLLIDDVVTTGGTVAECARALRRAGAEMVDVFAAAVPLREESKTPPPVRVGP
jgi:ComF family protein